MKFRHLILIQFILHLSASSQNYIDYYNEANKAEYLFTINDFQTSKNILTSLEVKFKELKPKEKFYLGIIYYLDNDTSKGQNYLIKCAGDFLGPSEYITRCIKKFPKISISNYVLNKIDFIENTYKNNIDKNIADSINYFFDLDQMNRSTEIVIPEIDYNIQSQLLSYLTRNGMPDVYKYGQFHLSIFIHVYDPDLLEKYKSFLLSEVKKGNLCAYYYCSMVDRNLRELNNSTLYNSYGKICEQKKCYDEIIKNRLNVGLSIYYDGTCEYPTLNNRTLIKQPEN